MIIQQWYQSYNREHTKVRDGGRRHHKGTNIFVQSGDAKCTRGDTWCCEDKKNKDNICYLDGQALKRNLESKVKKKVKFPNVVEVLGNTSIGGGVCSLSN